MIKYEKTGKAKTFWQAYKAMDECKIVMNEAGDVFKIDDEKLWILTDDEWEEDGELLFIGCKYYIAKEKEKPLKFPHPNSLWKYKLTSRAVSLNFDVRNWKIIPGGYRPFALVEFYDNFVCIFDGHKFLDPEIAKKFDLGGE